MPSWILSQAWLIDFALLATRLVIGGMFAMSGFFKLTDKERAGKMVQSLHQAGVPTALAKPLSLGELVGGALLVLGLLMVPAALVLLAISLGALVTTAIPKADGQGIHKLENVLYTPEALLVVALLMLLALGSGAFGLDALLR